jgi:sigma-E factor negative regulatory protein RseA
MDKMDNQELISALADGQLRGEALAQGVRAAAAEAGGRRTWQAYQVIGEVLRSGECAAGTRSEAFLARLQVRLEQETVTVPAEVAAPVAAIRVERPAANDWRWKLVAGFASVAAVGAVGWNVWGTPGAGAGQPQLAAAPGAIVPVAATTADPRAAAMIRDPHLDQLMAAHRQFGGATALQNPSGFLRNATFEGPAR